jgi:hypothetical protein
MLTDPLDVSLDEDDILSKVNKVSYCRMPSNPEYWEICNRHSIYQTNTGILPRSSRLLITSDKGQRYAY